MSFAKLPSGPDLTEFGSRSYMQIIKNPMDLSTMGVKVDQGLYKNRSAFEQDFRLMVSNAKLYNAPKSYPFEEAHKLETYFEKGGLHH